MIKLKSLFRRGQGGPSGSSKHGNNNRNKSQSTSSLNTSSESTTEQQQQLNNKHQKLEQQLQQQQQSTFYSQHSSERGVDVGDDELLNNHLQPQQQQHRNNGGATKNTRSATPDSTQSGSNTLPHKRSKTSSSSSSSAANTPKKAPKQPKLVPQPPQQQQQQQPDSSSQVLHGNVMTTLAVAPGTQNAATTPTGVGGPQSALSSGGGGGGGNNNYNGSAAAAVAQDLYKFNQFIQNEQQQQLLEATTSKMQQLQEQLDIMEHDKRMLELRVGELLPYQGEVGKLKNELIKMQGLHEKNQMEISNLKYENESLRNRLHDVVNSPLSDSEKHQIIQDSQRLHSSAPASIALPTTIVTAPESESPLPGERSAPPTTPSCLTPDWDKQSSSSEISVACLQDKIIQMEETHYSTSEELQATLQELADLQNQLSDAHVENERLAEEKDVLFQSLCRQTEKLNDARTQITHLQELLVEDAKRQQEEVGASERENKLLDLIKTSQEEREAILVKQEEMNGELSELRQTLETSAQEAQCCHERIALLESTLDAASAERKQLDAQHSQARDELSQQQLEINRLSTLLENARSKIEELEADLARGEKTDLTDVLDAARKEKDALEERVAEIQDQHSRSQAECRRLREQLSAMTEECKVAKNNAKCAVSHLEYRLEQLKQEKDKLHAEYQQLAESSAELQVQCKCHLEDKTQLQTLLSETQTHLCEAERKLKEGEERLEKEIALRKQEAEEWQQFQSDLLMTVRVANDFKTEALSAREQSMMDNKTLKEKIRLLEQQIDKLTKQQSQQNDTQQAAPLGGSTAPTEVVTRRHHPLSSFGTTSGSAAVSSTTTAAPTSAGSLLLSRQDSRLSVKTLIESIENNSTKGDTDVEASSSVGSSAASTPSASTNSTPEITPNTPAPLAVAVAAAQPQQSSTLNGTVSTTSTTAAVAPTTTTNGPTSGKGPLREQQQQQQTSSLVLNNYSSLNNLSKTILTGDRKDPLNMLAKNGGSKRNALLKWCQNKTVGYRNIDITNFSSSWNDGLAFCAILHSYLPDRIPYDTLTPANKRRNFSLAFAAAESVGIPTTLNINDMCAIERPEWKDVMTYITDIYKHFET